jgi:hypothetical protein
MSDSETSIFSRILDLLARPFRLDLRSLALFRIGLGLLLIADIVNRVWYLRAHYTDWGIMPREVVFETLWNSNWISLHMANGALWFQVLLFAIATLASIAIVVGYRTKWAVVIAWLLTISVQARNPLIGQGGDIVFRLLLFWGFFLPIEKVYSLDSALHRIEDDDGKSSVVSMASIAYVFQVCFIYGFAYLLKTGDEWHPDLTAVYYALHLDQFTTPIGDFLRQQEFILDDLTLFTLGLEGFAWLLLFIPFFHRFFRLLAVALFISMHLGFAATMRLGLFSYISCVAWLALLPTGFWEARFETFREAGEEYRIECADRDGAFWHKIGRILRTFLILPRASIESRDRTDDEDAPPESVDDVWAVVVPSGTRHTGYDGLVELVAASPLFGVAAPVLRWGPIAAVGRFIWRLPAKRHDLATRLAESFPFRERAFRAGIFRQTVAGIALVLCFLWNLQTLPSLNYSMPDTLRTATVAFRLDQKWNMFAPYPLKDDGWYVVPATLKDGTRFDLFQRDPTVDWAKPKDVSATYQSQRWRKYMMNLWMAKHSGQRLYYGKYLCRRWNSRHQGDNQLKTFKIFFMKETTGPEDPEPSATKTHLWTHYCFKQPGSEQNDGADSGGDEEAGGSDSTPEVSDELLDSLRSLDSQKTLQKQ